MHERVDEILERLLVEEVEQHDVGPVVAGGEMVDGPRAGAAERRAEELPPAPSCPRGRPFLVSSSSPVSKLIFSKRPDGEEAVEGVVLKRDGGEQ